MSCDVHNGALVCSGYRIIHNKSQVRWDQISGGGVLLGGFLGVAAVEGPKFLRAARGSAIGFVLGGIVYSVAHNVVPEHEFWK